MKEFYLGVTNKAIEGPLELSDALDLIPFYVPVVAKRRAIEAYNNGKSYKFDFAYGFNSATVTVKFLPINWEREEQ